MTPEPTREETFDYGPYLLAALLCEKVLDEKDGVKSVIRIIDQLTHTVVGPNPPEQMEPFDYRLAFLVSFKAGQARGNYKVEIRPVKPSVGDTLPPLKVTIHFTGPDERGFDVRGDLTVRFDQEGVWWFDILLNGKRITRIPFRVIYSPQAR